MQGREQQVVTHSYECEVLEHRTNGNEWIIPSYYPCRKIRDHFVILHDSFEYESFEDYTVKFFPFD
jgi:hypothetical protein